MFRNIFHWVDENILFVLSAFLFAFIPLYPKLPLFDVLPGYIVRVRVEDMLIGLTGFIWLIQLLRKKITWKSPLFKLIGTYTVIGFFSIVSGMLLIHTIPLELLHIGKSALHLFRYAEYFFLFVLMYSSMKSVKQAKIVLWTLVITVLAISIYGVGQKYWYWPVYSTMNREFSKGMRLYLTEHARVQSTFGGHYDLGAYLVVVLPILLTLAHKAQRKWERRIFSWTHAFGLWLLVVSASRAPFAAYGVAALLVLILTSWSEPTWWKRFTTFLRRAIGFGMLMGVLLLGFGEDINERFMQVVESYPQYPRVVATFHDLNGRRILARDYLYYHLGISNTPPRGGIGFDNSGIEPVLTPTDELPVTKRPSDVYEDIPDLVKSADGSFVEKERTWSPNALKYGLSMAIRLDALWPNAVKGFLRNPLLGSGYATLNKESATHFTEADSTDNNFLRVLGETGALGFVVFFGIIVIAMRLMTQHFFDKNTLASALAVGLFAGSIGLLLNALYIDVYAASKVAFTYWALVGFALAVFGLKQKKSKQSSKKSKTSK